MNLRSFLKIAIGVSCTAFFIFLISKDFNSERLLEALHKLNAFWLFLGVVCLVKAYGFRIFRWQILISDVEHKPHISKCAVTFLSSIALNNTLPLRSGDAFRAFATANWLETKTEKILAAMLFEKIIDLICLVLLLCMAAVVFVGDPENFLDTLPLNASALLTILSVALLALIAVHLAIRLKVFDFPKCKSIIGGQKNKLIQRVENFFVKFQDFLTYKKIITLFGVSMVSWIAEMGVFVASAFAMPDLTKKLSAFFAAPVGTLSTLLPSTPGYVGTFHYSVAQVAELAGNTVAASLAFAFVVHLMLWIPTTICGAACFVYWTVKGRKV